MKWGQSFPIRCIFFCAFPKSDKMELIIQKTVELGVYTVIPVAMKNCVVKLDEKKAQSKCKRWQAIAESAAKQSKHRDSADSDATFLETGIGRGKGAGRCPGSV